MNINKLDQQLTDIVNTYSDNVRSLYKEGSHEPATEHDINELARQTFYALDEFRKNIINYLKEQDK